MAGRRWAQRTPSDAPAVKRRPRPSQRAGGGDQPTPSPAAMARAKELLSPPKAPWHPLPLAELAIVLGALAMLAAAVLTNGDGIIAGFVLVLLGTAEFSWREHHHGYRSHGAVLAGIAAFAAGIICWKFAGFTRNVCIGAGIAVFLAAWGLFDRAYTPATARTAYAGTKDTPKGK